METLLNKMDDPKFCKKICLGQARSHKKKQLETGGLIKENGKLLKTDKYQEHSNKDVEELLNRLQHV